MEDAAELGLSPREAVDWTVREFRAFAAGCARRHRAEMQTAMWTAWHTAQFTRAKKMPALDRLMRKIGRRPSAKPKSPEQLLQIARQITVQMRGSESKGKP